MVGKKYAGGLGLSFFTSEKAHPSDADNVAREALHLIMMGYKDPQHWKRLQTVEMFKAVFVKRNEVLLRAMRRGFRDAFQDIFKQLDALNYQLFDPLNETDELTLQHNQAVLFLSNCLSLLPFADIKPDDKFDIPEWDTQAKKWNLVTFKVAAIELTPTWGLGALVLEDPDRVFAYGLTPKFKQKATFQSKPQPHLIFMGTTYPAGQGFALQLFTNLEWFGTPGLHLFRNGKAGIIKWLAKSTAKAGAKARVHGVSLGGSTAYFTALDKETAPYISRVDAYNSPGLCETLFTNYQKQWDDLSKKLGEETPKVYVQMHESDPISGYFGSWLKGWHILNVIPSEEDNVCCSVLAHALSDTHFRRTEVIEIADIDAENKRRWWFNFGVNTLLRSVLFGLFALPCHYLVVPICRAVLNHKLELVIISAIAVTFMLFSGMLASPMGIVALVAASVYLGYKLIEPMKRLVGGFVKAPLCHIPDTDEMKQELHELHHASQFVR